MISQVLSVSYRKTVFVVFLVALHRYKYFSIDNRNFELKPKHKNYNPLTNPLYYKIGAKPSEYEEFFKIPLMKESQELHSHPADRVKLSTYYNSVFTASMNMCNQLADINPELNIETQTEFEIKVGLQEKLEQKRQDFTAA